MVATRKQNHDGVNSSNNFQMCDKKLHLEREQALDDYSQCSRKNIQKRGCLGFTCVRGNGHLKSSGLDFGTSTIHVQTLTSPFPGLKQKTKKNKKKPLITEVTSISGRSISTTHRTDPKLDQETTSPIHSHCAQTKNRQIVICTF